MPAHRHFWKVPAYRLKNLLREHGFASIEAVSSLVTFEIRSANRFPSLERIVLERYRKQLPTLKILSIRVEPTSRRIEAFRFNDGCSMILPERALLGHKGTFVVRCNKRRFFFKYEVNGRIRIYKANHQIKKDRIIHLSDLTATSVPFGRYYAKPVISIRDGAMMARQNIAKGKTLLQTMATVPYAIRRHDTVRCIFQDGAVTLEFDGTALQNGAIGDEILIRNPNGGTLRGTIMKNKTVKIR